MSNLFRIVVLVSTLLMALAYLFPFYGPGWLSESGQELWRVSGHASMIPHSTWLYWGLFVVWLVISTGLFFFISMARTAFAVVLAITAVATFFWGYRVYTPFEEGLRLFVAVADGWVLAMAYMPPLSGRFSGDEKDD